MKTSFLLCVCLALGVLAKAQNNPGFMSINCGASTGYLDRILGIQYTSDAGFVTSGKSMPITSNTDLAVYQYLMNVRAFPNGTRNCYTLNPTQGKNNRYLIRASFHYGNYDGKAQVATFDLHIDTNYWTTISPGNHTFREIIYTPTRDYINVCLVNLGKGTPFISALELRLLPTSTYETPSGAALVLLDRRNFGSVIPYRYPQDDYDRYWRPVAPPIGYIPVNTTATNFERNDAYKIPTAVLMTAERVPNTSFYIHWKWTSVPPMTSTVKWYTYLHFAEIEILQPGQVRVFQIYAQDTTLQMIVRPEYLKPVTFASPAVSASNITLSVNSTAESNLPPFVNALESFYAPDLPNSLTDLTDVTAINGIKSTYKVTKDSWQGDPCFPQVLAWDGLNCSNDNFPRITSLNLSSSGLTGKIVSSFSGLTALVVLDLSFNQLNGQLPEFLAEMKSLRILNLEGNSLTGAIPTVLQERISDGTLQINLTGNQICHSSCDSGRGTKISVVIAVIASIVLLVLAILVFSYIRVRKRMQARGSEEGASGIGKTTRAFTSSEVSTITDNFNVTIGEGGFGKVFLGTLSDGTKVAVKVLSQSSKQGYKEFQAEAQLLMIVHHKNLVSLLGYCNDFENMALIYELMSHGNLRQHLSECNVNVLSWKQRLQVAVDAAQGLEYLHNGCKPPIIHRDLKTSNILLDENMQAKIADFGLSRIFKPENDSHISTCAAGTPGYLDPVFHTTGKLKKTSDIYSFGIILLELITGHPAIIRNLESNTHIVQWVIPLIEAGDVDSIADSRMHSQFNSNSVWKVVEIALQCVDPEVAQRPDINRVLAELKESLEIEISSGDAGGNLPKSNSFKMASMELDSAPSAR